MGWPVVALISRKPRPEASLTRRWDLQPGAAQADDDPFAQGSVTVSPGGGQDAEQEADARPGPTGSGGPRRGQPSLRGRALAHLSRREHSRLELARKLARHEPDPARIEALLDELERLGHLSEARFIESVVHRRGERFGARRITQELEQHGVDRGRSREALECLEGSEFERAWAIWQRRFGHPPIDLKERARQQRFLAARGFDGGTIGAVFRAAASVTL